MLELKLRVDISILSMYGFSGLCGEGDTTGKGCTEGDGVAELPLTRPVPSKTLINPLGWGSDCVVVPGGFDFARSDIMRRP